MKKLISSILVVLTIATVTPSSLAAPQPQKPAQSPAAGDIIRWRLFGLSDSVLNQAIQEGQAANGDLNKMTELVNPNVLVPTSENFIKKTDLPQMSVITPYAFVRFVSMNKAMKYETLSLQEAKEITTELNKNKQLQILIHTYGETNIDYDKLSSLVIIQGKNVVKPFLEDGKNDIPDVNQYGKGFEKNWIASFNMNLFDPSQPVQLVYKQNPYEFSTYTLDFSQLK